jgi:hypothetical protein
MARTYLAQSVLALPAMLFAILGSATAWAQAEEQIDRKPVTCVLVNRIERGVGVNDRTVLFYMRGGQIFRNDLLQSCPALTAGETRLVYNYRVASAKITRLCGDSFSVERKPGLECLLGKFNPITAAEAQALRGEPSAAPPASGASNGERAQSPQTENRRN